MKKSMIDILAAIGGTLAVMPLVSTAAKPAVAFTPFAITGITLALLASVLLYVPRDQGIWDDSTVMTPGLQLTIAGLILCMAALPIVEGIAASAWVFTAASLTAVAIVHVVRDSRTSPEDG